MTDDKQAKLVEIAEQLRSVAVALQLVSKNIIEVSHKERRLPDKYIQKLNILSQELLLVLQQGLLHSNNSLNNDAATIVQEIILIDDSDIFRKTWDLEAEINDISITSFATPQAFIKQMSHYDKNIPVFIDINLAEDINGIVLAEQAHVAGFKTIFLLTGDNISDLAKPLCVCEILDKLTPFHEIKEKLTFIQNNLEE